MIKEHEQFVISDWLENLRNVEKRVKEENGTLLTWSEAFKAGNYLNFAILKWCTEYPPKEISVFVNNFVFLYFKSSIEDELIPIIINAIKNISMMKNIDENLRKNFALAISNIPTIPKYLDDSKNPVKFLLSKSEYADKLSSIPLSFNFFKQSKKKKNLIKKIIKKL